MPTPEALEEADYIRRCCPSRERWEAGVFNAFVAVRLDRFAAQRGAEATGSGDAGERAREDAATLRRIVYQNECAPTCPPGHEDIKFLLRLIREDRAALLSSHREGAEAMREAVVKRLRSEIGKGFVRIIISDAIRDINALPIRE